MNNNNKKYEKDNKSEICKKDEIVQPIIDLSVFDPYRDYRCEEVDTIGYNK